jgi:alkylation response protein AidB-like acyl-CoA dehydrogenase
VNFDDDADETEFRLRAQDWLAANVASRAMPVAVAVDSTGLVDGSADLERDLRWQRRLFDAGWAGIAWPTEYGGQGRSAVYDAIFNQEQVAVGVPADQHSPFTISIGMVGPTLFAHGTPAQRAQYLPPMLTGADIWCQLFSEPGAGSDLAGLRTRAERRDGGWVVNGQKVWTSGARMSRYGALLARTDPSRPKHAGISFFILDMSTPGIELRPIRQMNGEARFNEVWFQDAWVPDGALVGDLNDGWRVANTLLLSERGLVGERSTGNHILISELARRQHCDDDPLVRQKLGQVYAQERVLWLLGCKARTAAKKGIRDGAIASVTKLLTARHHQYSASVALDVLGADGLCRDDEAASLWQDRFLKAPMLRIAGGTDEIQKNIIGERHLNLPAEWRPDRGKPFQTVPNADSGE